MSEFDRMYRALQKFATAVKDKMGRLVVGEPEDQLRGPFETLVSAGHTRRPHWSGFPVCSFSNSCFPSTASSADKETGDVRDD